MEVSVHRCRFFDYSRPAISALAFSDVQSTYSTRTGGKQRELLPPSPELRLAIGRSNGDIELWNPRPQNGWTLDSILYSSQNHTVEDLVWLPATNDLPTRLLSVGASDSIFEWDLAAGRPLRQLRLDAGIVWALSRSPDGQRVAAACESGVVVIIDVSDGELAVSRRFARADASLVSIDWLGERAVVCGCSDARIRVWDATDGSSGGRLVSTMKVDKSKGDDQTFVWAVKSLRGGSFFVSGDSTGSLKIWDGKALVLQQSIQAHAADILGLATDAANDTVFSAGLDQKIVALQVTDAKRGRWAPAASVVAQSNEIRCLAGYEARGQSYLVSGGLESALAVNSISQFATVAGKRLPLPRYRPAFAVCPVDQDNTSGANSSEEKTLATEFVDDTLKVWALVGSRRRLALELRATNGAHIADAAICTSRKLLAVVTPQISRVFSVEGLPGRVSSVTPLTDELPASLAAKFGSAGLVMLAAESTEQYDGSTGSGVFVWAGPGNAPVELPQKRQHNNVSPANALLAVRDELAVVARGHLVDVYNTVLKQHVGTLPRAPEEITAVVITSRKTVAAVCTDRNVMEYNTDSMALTDWTKKHTGRLPLQLLRQSTPCIGLFSDPKLDNRLWLWGPTWLAFLDLDATSPFRKAAKRDRPGQQAHEAEDSEEPASDSGRTFWLTTAYRPLFFAGPLDDGILVSERPAVVVAKKAKSGVPTRHIRL